MNKIRVGFIGTGRISDLHAIEYLNNPHAQIVALCDADPALAEARATAWGLDDVRICDDYAELLALDQVDLVDILLPHHLHAEVALAAMAAGKAVSLQKPMTLTLDEADRLVEAAASSQARFRVFENFLFYPPIVKAKALIDEGAIGTPLTIRLKSNSGNREMAWKVPASAQAWRQDRAMAGGGPCVFDDGHHKFAIAWYFMGAAEQVHAWIGQTEMPNGSMRDSPAIAVAQTLTDAGVKVSAYDPEGMEIAKPLMPQVSMCDDPFAAIEGADATVIVTEWDAFRALDLGRVKELAKTPVLVDLRNIYNPADVRALGFTYESIGRA